MSNDEPRTLDFEARRRAPKPFPTQLLLPREERLRRRPRDPGEEEVLTRILVAKLDLYRKSGKIEFIGPRERRYHLGRAKIVAYLKEQRERDEA